MTGDTLTVEQVRRWQRDPVAFVQEVLINPETNRPFVLLDAEVLFLQHAFTLRADGSLPYSELVYSCPKKSGKSTFAAMCLIYSVVVLGGRFAEGYALANSLEQSQSRVYRAAVRIVEASPLLRESATVKADRTEFTGGSFIQALVADYESTGGANPTLSAFDELWAYTTERSHRLWDEMVPSPARIASARLTVTFAGFEGESGPLRALYERGIQGEEIAPSLYRAGDLLMLWSHLPIAGWQTPEWIESMRRALRPAQFQRMIENRWTTSEEAFITPVEWAKCVDRGHRLIESNPELPAWAAIDASTRRDSTAICACTWDALERRVWLIWHKIFVPTPGKPIDFNAVERELFNLTRRFDLRGIWYDPFQLAHTSQRLRAAGVRMIEVPQTLSNTTEFSTNLFDLIKAERLVVYDDEDVRKAVLSAVAIESSRGWRLGKEKSVHRIDAAVALAMAALATVQASSIRRHIVVGW